MDASAPHSIPTFKLRQARLLGDRAQPWRSGQPELQAINPIPGMICGDESQFLHWIAKYHLSGEGQVVDLGPLAGGSTHALCTGLARNAAASRVRVHSYDLWCLFPGQEAYFPGECLKIGDDLHPLFLKNLKAFGNLVVSHPGDMRGYRWTGEPIEILFIDAAKALELWSHIRREFLPYCIAGKSLVVHQDWVSAECPWIHLTTARLSEYFVPVDSPAGGTVAFLVQRALPRALLEDDDFWNQPLPAAADRFQQAASWMTSWYALEVRLAEAHYLIMRGKRPAALRIVDEVLEHPDFAASVQYDVDLVRASSRKSQWRQAPVFRSIKYHLLGLIKPRKHLV